MLIFGKNSVVACLNNSKKIVKIFLSDSFKDIDIITLIRKNAVPVEVVKKGKLDNLVKGELHQGIVAQIANYQYADLNSVIKDINKKRKGIVLILDGIEDPHNLGAIIRTSEAVGVSLIVIGKNNCAEVNSTVYKVSTGAVENIKIAQVSNLSTCIDLLKENDYWIMALESDGSKDYRQIEYSDKVGIIIGSEGKGISHLLKQRADHLIKLPMVGKVNSLNASVATAIILYHIHNYHFPI